MEDELDVRKKEKRMEMYEVEFENVFDILEECQKQMQSVSSHEVMVPHFNLGDFSDLSSIAIGGEGEVSRGTHNNLGIVAVKTLFVPVSIHNLKELDILIEPSFSRIVRLFGIFVSDGDLTKCSGYVMELMEFGSLNSVIYDPSVPYDMRQIYSWIEQAGRGLEYLHDRNIIHRDIKPNKFVDYCSLILFSMLLASIDDLKIAYFPGLAREIVIDESITGGIETCFYMAPEIIETHSYGPPADVYAFIVSIWEIVHRKKPYYDLKDISMDTFSKEVTENRRRPIIKEELKVDAEMRELIQKGWDADAAKRVTIHEIIKYAEQKKDQEDGILHRGENQIPWYKETAFTILERLVIHNKSINYDLDQKYTWLCGAASGIMYLHNQNIIHRDIKPSNLLLGDTLDDLKVADFGLARYTLGKSTFTAGMGTDGYTAPEVLTTGKYNNAADVYSFTTTIWEIFHRKKPLDEFTDKITKHVKIIRHELTTKVVNGWHPTIDSSCIEPDVERLLERGWRKEPLQRITFKEILDAILPIVKVQPTILVLGGDKSNKMHLLNRDRTRWTTLWLKLPISLNSGGAVYLEGEIYIFRGIDSEKKTYKLNREMKWIQLADMNEGRGGDISRSSVVFDGCIWVCGGWNHSGWTLNSVEKYIPEEDKWIQMPPMKERRYCAAAAACKGKLFVCGGSSTSSMLRSMECFDPASQRWTMFLDLPSLAYGHALISDGICLTVLGGEGGRKSVWKINPNEETASWKKLPQMREGRGRFTANLLGDNIFVIRGDRYKKVDVFNGETWEDGPELPGVLKNMCSIVIPAQMAAALSYQ